MFQKKFTVTLLILLILILIAVTYAISSDDIALNQQKERVALSEEVTNETKTDDIVEQELLLTEKENEYYSVYIEGENEDGSSFVPLTLNPGFDYSNSFNISMSFDDDGKILNDEKVLIIENFTISDKNKEDIKKIVGEDKFEEALQEIEAKISEAVENLNKN